MKPVGWHILQDYRYREHPYLHHHPHHRDLILVFMLEALLTIIVITMVVADFGCFFQHHSCSLRHPPRQIRSLRYHLHLLQDHKVGFPIFRP